MTKLYSEVKDENVRRALVEVQATKGIPAETAARRDGDFLMHGDKLFFAFKAGSTDWREVTLS